MRVAEKLAQLISLSSDCRIILMETCITGTFSLNPQSSEKETRGGLVLFSGLFELF